MKSKVKYLSFAVFTVSIVIVVIYSIAVRHESGKHRSSEVMSLNEIYEFSVPIDIQIVEQEPEEAPLTIMYFHQLRDLVDEDTFFKLKEKTVTVLSKGEIDAIPEKSKEKIEAIKSTNSALCQNIKSVDKLIIYEVDIAGVIVRFKYLQDEERLFSEIREVL